MPHLAGDTAERLLVDPAHRDFLGARRLLDLGQARIAATCFDQYFLDVLGIMFQGRCHRVDAGNPGACGTHRVRALRLPSATGVAAGDTSRKSILRSSTLARSTRMRRSEEHTSELQSLMRTSYAVFCLKKKNKQTIHKHQTPGHS